MEKTIPKLHQELLKLKISLLQTEIGKTVDAIALEMGIDIVNEKWSVSSDGTKLIKVEKT
jgi:hypothetical protein